MQILKAKSRSELADRLRFTIKYKGKALVAYFVFFITYALLFIAFLYLLGWVKGQPYQLHWGYFALICIYAITFPIGYKFSDYRIPFFSFEKYFIDPVLVQDLNKLEYIKTTATITDIKIPSKQFFKPKLHTLTLQLDERNEVITDTSVHLKLLFRNIYFTNSNYTQFYADPAWIGTKVEICFLPKSKRIIQLIADTDQHDFQDLTTESVNKSTLHKIPSRFAQELFAVQHIEATRSENSTWQYELIVTTIFHNQYHIPANSQGFAKLEQILSNRVDFLKYRQFKQNPSIQSQILYQPRMIKMPRFLPQIISTPNKAFL
ncbi:hypothetical protein [Acinetobacter modestus]|uniref:hypothetical protein n=1 Tax=Acinetobacter modestus TaxID=1776740 RepID=UPI001F4AF360|nr:hypothetical protein [Acinetobacter modestus]MCH7329594.1 hypothetical protein [Acinetobacter modestus]